MSNAVAPAKEIVIKNCGKVPLISIPVPVPGGVVELLGTNDAGKSNLLLGLRRMGGADVDFPIRDGQKSGSIEGMGIKMEFSRKTKTSGELVLKSFESFADITGLVDPRVDDKVAADARRIKVLLRMSGVKPSREMFTALLNGGIERAADVLLSTDIIEDDIVKTGAKVKSRFEERARAKEEDIRNAQAVITANQKDLDGIDLTLADQVEMLRSLHEAAIADKADITGKKESADKALRAAMEAQANLDKATKPTKSSETIAFEIAELSAEIARLEKTLELKKEQKKSYDELLKTTKSLEDGLKAWQETIAASKDVKAPTEQEVLEVSQSAEVAKQQYEAALTASRLAPKAKEITQKQALLEESEEQAKIFRAAAEGTALVLANALQLDNIRIKDRRLVTDTERGETFFDEVSVGTKYRMSIKWAAHFLGEGGMIVTDQQGWEGLVPSVKDEIREYAKEHGIAMFTARADESSGDGNVRAEIYESNNL